MSLVSYHKLFHCNKNIYHATINIKTLLILNIPSFIADATFSTLLSSAIVLMIDRVPLVKLVAVK